jgi:hypothetical protein
LIIGERANRAAPVDVDASGTNTDEYRQRPLPVSRGTAEALLQRKTVLAVMPGLVPGIDVFLAGT